VEDQVKELFAVMLRVTSDNIHDDTRPSDLERWDSLQHMILVAGFEEEFNLSIDPEDAVEMYKDFGTFKRIIIKEVKEAG
jgi:acyl carrier protein